MDARICHTTQDMKKLLLFILLLFISTRLNAQDTGSGLDFLNIGPSSRLLAISEAATATLTGASAIYTNPSLLANEPSSSLDANYTLWIAEVNNQFAAVNLVRRPYAVAFGVYSSRADEFEARNGPGDPSGLFSIGYLSLAGAIAFDFGPLSAGITGQYLREEMLEFRANGYAMNAGINSAFFENRIRAGLSLNNIGKMESLNDQSTQLPATLNAGIHADVIEFSTPGENDLPVLISLHAGWNKPIEDNTTSDFTSGNPDDRFVSMAVSVDAANLIFLQSGYRFGPTERPFSVGAGLLLDPVRVNYALIPFSTGFGAAHSFGLQFYF